MINAIGTLFILSLAYRVTLGDLSSGTTPEGCQHFIKLDYSQLTFDSCLRNSIDNGTWYHFESHSIEDSCYECESGLALMGRHPSANGYSRSKLGLSNPERGCFLTEYGVEVLNCPEGFIYKFEELPACSIKHELCLVGPKSRVKRGNPSSSASSSSSSSSSSLSSSSASSTVHSSSSTSVTPAESSSDSSSSSSSTVTSSPTSSSSSPTESSSSLSTTEASSTSSEGAESSSSSTSSPFSSTVTSSPTSSSSSPTESSSSLSTTEASSTSSEGAESSSSSTSSPFSSTSSATSPTSSSGSVTSSSGSSTTSVGEESSPSTSQTTTSQTTSSVSSSETTSSSVTSSSSSTSSSGEESSSSSSSGGSSSSSSSSITSSSTTAGSSTSTTTLDGDETSSEFSTSSSSTSTTLTPSTSTTISSSTPPVEETSSSATSSGSSSTSTTTTPSTSGSSTTRSSSTPLVEETSSSATTSVSSSTSTTTTPSTSGSSTTISSSTPPVEETSSSATTSVSSSTSTTTTPSTSGSSTTISSSTPPVEETSSSATTSVSSSTSTTTTPSTSGSSTTISSSTPPVEETSSSATTSVSSSTSTTTTPSTSGSSTTISSSTPPVEETSSSATTSVSSSTSTTTTPSTSGSSTTISSSTPPVEDSTSSPTSSIHSSSSTTVTPPTSSSSTTLSSTSSPGGPSTSTSTVSSSTSSSTPESSSSSTHSSTPISSTSSTGRITTSTTQSSPSSSSTTPTVDTSSSTSISSTSSRGVDSTSSSAVSSSSTTGSLSQTSSTASSTVSSTTTPATTSSSTYQSSSTTPASSSSSSSSTSSSSSFSSSSSTRPDEETDGEGEDSEGNAFVDILVIAHDKPLYGIVGGETILTCVLTSDQEKKIFWYKDDEGQQGGATQTSETNYSDDFQMDVHTVTSVIPATSTGLWKCKFAGNQDLEESVPVYIIEPVIEAEDIFQRKDKPVTMTCFAPKESVVSFFKDDQQMTKEGVDEIFEQLVDTEQRESIEWIKYEKVIEFARLEQNGVVYSCKAEFENDQVVVDHSFTLEIADAVVLTTKPETEAFFAIGARVTITCLANVEVVGGMTWYRKRLPKNVLMEAEAGVTELKTGVTAGVPYTELTFVSAEKSDSASYFCVAEEVESPEIALEFHSVEVEVEDVVVQEGETVSLTCSAPEGSTISFYKDNQLLSEITDEEDFTKLKEETSATGHNMFVWQKVILQVKLDRDGEVFKCTAVLGDLTVLEHTFTLEISRIASLEISAADKYHKAGSKISLVCIANKKLSSAISWWVEVEGSEDKQILAVSNSITVEEEVNSDRVTEGTLTYLSAREEHSGSYYCKGEEKRSTNDMPLMIIATKDQEESLTVNDGVFFTLNCWSYKEDFEFTKDGSVFSAYTFEKTYSAVDLGHWEKKLLKVKLTDQQDGKFECVSMFDTFKVSSFIYNIDVVPLGDTVLTPTEGYPMIPLGTDLTITCNLVAIAEVNLIWMKDDKEVNDRYYENEYEEDISTQTSVLILENVIVAESGSYSCMTVDQGSASSVDVKIFDPKDFTYIETKFEVVSTEVEFVCYGVSGEDITVTWAGETVELTNDDYEKKEDYSISGFEMDRYEVKYTIDSLDDAGTYGCKSEGYGHDIYSLTGTLDVFTKPEIKIPGIIGGSYTTVEGSEFEVTGQIQASKDISAETKMVLVLEREGESDLEKDLPSPTWDDKMISSVFKVENVPATYTGEYVLKVTAATKKAESDALPLFVIAKHIETYEESLAVGEELEIVCYTQEGYDIKYYIDDKEVTDVSTLDLEDGTDYTDGEEIIFKTKLWFLTAVKETSNGVYRCKGFYKDDIVGDTTVTFHVLVFSDMVTYRAEPFGGDVKLLCYKVVQTGSYMKYYYMGTQDESVAPEIGKTIEKGGKQYQEHFWVLGEMTEEKQGKYKCESFVMEQKIVSMTSDLLGYTLTAPVGVLSDTGTATVDCIYKGPTAETMLWYLDGVKINSGITTSGTSADRQDGVTVNSLTVDSTLKIVKCEYELSGNYDIKISKEVLVTHAALSKIEEVTAYFTDDVQIKCDYTGSDNPNIIWYDMTDPEKPNPITSTDENDNVYIEKTVDGKKQSVELYLKDLGYKQAPLSCNIEFAHSTRSDLKYVNKQLTTMKRIGFSQELPNNIMSLPGTITLKCAWGSSDTPASVEWKIDGEPPQIDTSETKSFGYQMESTLEVTVVENTGGTYTCIFKDGLDNVGETETELYGASLEIDQGKEFYPTLDDNRITCTLTTQGTAAMTWLKDQQVVETSASQEVEIVDTAEIVLTSLKMDPLLDGIYICQVTAYGETFSKEIELAHTGVVIDGPQEIIVRSSEAITLTCNAASRAKIGKIRWDVNGNRLPQGKFENSDYVDFQMSSKLITNPVEDAITYGGKVLDYECVAATAAGLVKEYKEITVLALELTPVNVVAVEGTWELTCTVISDIKPKFVVMKKGDEEKKKWADFMLKSETGQESDGEDLGPKPGEADYVVGEGEYTFQQDGNDFIMKVDVSTYKDAGTYTCQLIYADTSESFDTSTVKVRSVLSPQPEIYYTKKETVELTCVIYNDEAPDFGKWYYDNKLVGNSMAMDGNLYTTNHEVSDPALTDAGEYRCEFGFPDNKNPSHTLNLQFAELNMLSDAVVTVERGGSLELEAYVYSSNMADFSMIWYLNGEKVSVAKGFTPSSKKEGEGFKVTLNNPSIGTELGGEYHVEFTTVTYPVKLVSSVVKVAVIGSASETNIVGNDGGALTLSCEYQGSVAPASVTWNYKFQPVDQSKWTVNEGEYLNNVQKSTITASSMTVDESGDYDCVFKVGQITLTTTNTVTVRTISVSKSGTQYITSDTWEISVIVGSVDKPKNMFINQGQKRITALKLKALAKVGDSQTYILTLDYNKNNRAGKDDGEYTFEAVWKDEMTLKTDPVNIIARLALTDETNEKQIFMDNLGNKDLVRTCEYSGKDKPTVEWLLEDKVVVADADHVIKTDSKEVEGASSTYNIAKTSIVIEKPTWEDGGVYTCKFSFADGNNVEVTVPKTVVVQASGFKSCETSLDGSLELTCNFQTKETVESIVWTRWADEISEGFQTTNFVDNQISSVLTLTDAKPDQNGRYMCQAKVSGRENSFKYKTDIRFAELNMVVEPAAPHYAGSKAVIVCRDVGKFKDVELIKPDGQSAPKVQGNQRYSFEVLESTKGRYTCTGKATNLCAEYEEVDVTGKQESGEEGVDIQPVMPTVIKQPEDISVESGVEATFTCIVPAVKDDKSRMTWHKEGNEDKIIWGNSVEYDTENKELIKKLVFRKASFDASGKYKCRAKWGEVVLDSDYATLNVIGFKTAPTDNMGLLGGQAKFTCAIVSTEVVTLELKTSEGTGIVPNVVMDTQPTTESWGTIYTGIATLSGLTEDNGKGSFFCQVAGKATKSDSANLQVLSFFGEPALSNSWTAGGDTAGFTANIERFEWGADVTITWQKKLQDSWEDVPEGGKYIVQNAKAKYWYTFINIPSYSFSADEAVEWRVKLTLPDQGEKIGGDLISSSAFVREAGKTTIELNSADKFVGSTFTMTFTVTASERPSYMKVMFNGRRKKAWEKPEVMTHTFENNLSTVVVKSETLYWYSLKNIGCKTTVSSQAVEAVLPFYQVQKPCNTLERANGDITLLNKEDSSSTIIGLVASLKCHVPDDTSFTYQPYDTSLTEVTCLFSTGKYSETITTCNKVIAIDYSLLKVGLFLGVGTGYCETDQAVADLVVTLNSGANGDKDNCGFKNIEFPCAENEDCVFQPSETDCSPMTAGGNEGIFISAVFKLDGEIDITKAARDDPGSKYSLYKGHADSINAYYTAVKSIFWRCEDPRRRKREAFRGRMSQSTDGSVPTTKTASLTTTPTTPTTPTTKFLTQSKKETKPRTTERHVTVKKETKPRTTERHVTVTKQHRDHKTTVAEDVAFGEEELYVAEEFDVLDVSRLEDAEVISPLNFEHPYSVEYPDPADETEDNSDGTSEDETERTLGLPRWEFNMGTFILFIGLLAGVSVIFIFKIVVTMRQRMEGNKDYKYAQLCES
ncbi:uncharacterized protein LOC134819571 isoform X3 [Bolinopsis microptera]|uniref:uncharacterized protein LOC134819571 isoform X3 n=1 Tax=Bolinopsis microptera TaxID=2820187 RepID=UPI00307AD54A